MPEALPRINNKLWTIPMRDLLRGRVTGRLDWTAAIAAARLPVEVANLILRVVKDTRLHAMERAAVADELIAHFQDGLASGATAEELIGKFGDEQLAAKLIRGRRNGAGRFYFGHGCAACKRSCFCAACTRCC